MLSREKSIRTKKHKNKNTLKGVLFSLPAIIGFICFSAGPMIASLVLSFTKYTVGTAPKFVGFDNYVRMFSGSDVLFYKSLRATLLFVLLNVPTCLITAFIIALLLNNRSVRGLSFFRAVFYIPTIIPIVATAMIYMWLMSPDFGLFNVILKTLHLPTSQWIYGEETVLPSLLLMTAWTCGNIMVVFLAGLQGVPKELYEALEVDGGNFLQKLVHVTLPMMTPIIFFNGVMFFIASMQAFVPAAIMTQGGPNNASLFIVYYIYKQAFEFQQIGQACALGWILFILISSIAGLIVLSSKYWVYYGDTK